MSRQIPLLLLLGLAAACNSTEYKTAPPGANGAGTASPTPGSLEPPTQTVTYQQVHQQIFQPKCISCHSSGHPNLSAYSAFALDGEHIVPGNPEQSEIYEMVENGQMPRNGPPLTQAELDLVYRWIEQGAQNN